MANGDSGSTPTPRTEEFLDIEDAARELAETMKALSAGVDGYRDAAKEISGVTQATERLARGVEQVGARSGEALDVIISMGGPQIAKRLDATADRLAVLESRVLEVAELERTNAAAMVDVKSEVEGLGQAVRSAQTRITVLAAVAALGSVVAVILALTGSS